MKKITPVYGLKSTDIIGLVLDNNKFMAVETREGFMAVGPINLIGASKFIAESMEELATIHKATVFQFESEKELFEWMAKKF